MHSRALKIISFLLMLQLVVKQYDVEAYKPFHFPEMNRVDTGKILTRQYELLAAYLKKYSELKLKKRWVQLPTVTSNLKIGDSSELIKKIKTYFIFTEDLSLTDTSLLFDQSLLEAIKKFQKRTGLKETGKLSPDVLNEMCIPLDKRIQQISLNMERCKKMPVSINKECLIINIPDFRLYVIENDTTVWSMKIVVGKYKNKTAEFNSNIKYIVFCPYWNIPSSIMKKEILPALSRNPNYLRNHRMEWYGNGIRQLPGPSNSLGLIKFVFPNSHNIYLHDTPIKSLFGNQQRAFSHGCIRIEEPKKLALYLLRNDSEWNETKIDEAIQNGKEKYVTLKKTIQVVITYYTCWVDDKGILQFRHDIYNRDKKL